MERVGEQSRPLKKPRAEEKPGVVRPHRGVRVLEEKPGVARLHRGLGVLEKVRLIQGGPSFSKLQIKEEHLFVTENLSCLEF